MKKIITFSIFLINPFIFSLEKGDVFSQMKKMEKRMESFFKKSFNHKQRDFEVLHREDDNAKYIEIKADGIIKKALKINVSKGVISISGQVRKTNEVTNKNSNSYSSYISSFQKSFNVPDGVNENELSINEKDNKIIIKFPKKKI